MDSKVKITKIVNGWIVNTSEGDTFYKNISAYINEMNSEDFDVDYPQGEYVLSIDIVPAKTLGELNKEMLSAILTRDRAPYNPKVKEIDDIDVEITSESSQIYSSKRLLSINFNKYFKEYKLTDREFAIIAGVKTATFSSLRRNIRLGTTTFSHLSVRIAATLLAKYFEQKSKEEHK